MRFPLLLAFVLLAGTALAQPGAPPVIDGLEPADGALVGASATVAARYRDADGVDARSVRLTIDGEDVTKGARVLPDGIEYQPPAPWSEGKHSVRLQVADTRGNAAQAAWSFGVRASAPPSVTILEPAPGAVLDGNATLRLRFEDDQGLSSFEVGIDGEVVASRHYVQGRGLVPREAFENVTLDLAGLAEGEHAVQVAVVDVEGLEGTASLPFRIAREVDAQPPTPSAPVQTPEPTGGEEKGTPIPWPLAVAAVAAAARARRRPAHG